MSVIPLSVTSLFNLRGRQTKWYPSPNDLSDPVVFQSTYMYLNVPDHNLFVV
jgi:hypothetical protein